MNKTVRKGLLRAAFTLAVAGAVAAPLVAFTVLPAGAMAMISIYTALAPNVVALINYAHKMNKEEREAYNAQYPGVHLTDDEKTFTQSIFGKEIPQKNLERLTKHFLPKKKGTAGSVPGGETRRIDFYGEGYHEADYAQTQDAFNYGLFIHEMTHIWQHKHQLRSRDLVHRYKKIYDYELTEKSRFKKFGAEQQAAIIEDYARRFLFPHFKAVSRRIENTPENDALLKQVVEKKFPAARQTRLALEAKKNAKIQMLLA